MFDDERELKTPEEVFAAWSPPDSVWSRWAKPVLFAQMRKVRGKRPEAKAMRDAEVDWLPNARSGTAVVVNLPGTESIKVGLAAAEKGYRPVPLFNCTDGPQAVVEVSQLIGALAYGAEALRSRPLSLDAPPIFLLDSNRLQGVTSPAPGRFDNRWVVFPQDFPSPNFFRSQNITRAVLAQKGATLDIDLAPVLESWQKAGLELAIKNVDEPGSASPLQVHARRGFRQWYLWYGMFILMATGLRRNSAGGFGSRVPFPSSSGG